MSRLRTLPVAARVAAISAVVLTLGVLLGVAAFRSALQRTQLESLDVSIDTQMANLREIAAEGDIPARLATARDSPLFCQIVTQSGKVLGASANVSDMNLMVDPDSAVMRNGPVDRATTQVDNVDVRLTKERVATTAGPAWILVAAPLKNLRDAEASLMRQLRVGGPLLVLFGTVGIWVVARRALRPVDLLRRQVDAISTSDLTARVSEPRAVDEVGRLARTMNRLLDRLQISHDRQTRFVSDASHELRSPLATVRTRLEVALRAPAKADWTSVAEASLRQTTRMERLVDDLLMLARTDTKRVVDPVVVDLDEIIREEVGYLRSTSTIALDTSRVSGGRVLGQPDDLRRVIVNLTTNAIQFAKSAVSVSLLPTEDSVLLTIDDDGPGVPADQRERIFHRFMQLEESRVHGGRSGAGLGLAIVADVVTRHGGSIGVGVSPSGGARFAVTLPAAF